MTKIRTAEDLELALVQALVWQDWEDLTAAIRTAASYREKGVLTHDNGLVLKSTTGAEFQLTIIRSARAYDPGHECPECGDEFEDVSTFLDHLVDDHDWDEYDAIDQAERGAQSWPSE